MSQNSDSTLIARAALMVREHKLLAFCDAHPELKKALSLWMVDLSTREITYPEAASTTNERLALDDSSQQIIWLRRKARGQRRKPCRAQRPSPATRLLHAVVLFAANSPKILPKPISHGRSPDSQPY